MDTRKPARGRRAAGASSAQAHRVEPAEVPEGLDALRAALLQYFDAHQRELPWRRTRDPYAIWVSEVMLQQTRVETVVPYYERFLARFPTPRALADAPLEQVLAAWSGLGYYRRARMLHASARAVVDRHGGALPDDSAALRALPGIGRYTAGAVASIAFGRREPVVDGNVERVITRLFALGGDPRAGATKQRVWGIARAFAACDRPGDINQALMELGATVCVPVAPRCLLCPARAHCAAANAGEPERYPEKRTKAAPRAERWWALVAVDEGGAVWLAPAEKGRWEGMLLPLMGRGEGSNERVKAAAATHGLRCARVMEAGRVRHLLTHAAMDISVFRAEAESTGSQRMVPSAQLEGLAVPKVTHALLEAAGVSTCAPKHARR